MSAQLTSRFNWYQQHNSNLEQKENAKIGSRVIRHKCIYVIVIMCVIKKCSVLVRVCMSDPVTRLWMLELYMPLRGLYADFNHVCGGASVAGYGLWKEDQFYAEVRLLNFFAAELMEFFKCECISFIATRLRNSNSYAALQFR